MDYLANSGDIVIRERRDGYFKRTTRLPDAAKPSIAPVGTAEPVFDGWCHRGSVNGLGLRARYTAPMIHRLALLAALLAASLPAASGAARGQESGLACAAATIGDYAKAKIALYQGRTLFSSPTVEFTLRMRRLKEEYCLRYTRCLFNDPNGFAFTQNFANCVRDKE